MKKSKRLKCECARRTSMYIFCLLLASLKKAALFLYSCSWLATIYVYIYILCIYIYTFTCKNRQKYKLRCSNSSKGQWRWLKTHVKTHVQSHFCLVKYLIKSYIGGFLKWVIPKSPWVSMPKWVGYVILYEWIDDPIGV